MMRTSVLERALQTTNIAEELTLAPEDDDEVSETRALQAPEHIEPHRLDTESESAAMSVGRSQTNIS